MSILVREVVRTLDAAYNGDILDAEEGFLSAIEFLPKTRTVGDASKLKGSFARAKPILPDFVQVSFPPSLQDMDNALKLLFFWVMAKRIIPVDWRTFKEDSEDVFFEYSKAWLERWKKGDPASYKRMFALLTKTFDIENRKFYHLLSRF